MLKVALVAIALCTGAAALIESHLPADAQQTANLPQGFCSSGGGETRTVNLTISEANVIHGVTVPNILAGYNLWCIAASTQRAEAAFGLQVGAYCDYRPTGSSSSLKTMLFRIDTSFLTSGRQLYCPSGNTTTITIGVSSKTATSNAPVSVVLEYWLQSSN